MPSSKAGKTLRLTDDGWVALDSLMKAWGLNMSSTMERLVRERAREEGVWGAPITPRQNLHRNPQSTGG